METKFFKFSELKKPDKFSDIIDYFRKVIEINFNAYFEKYLKEEKRGFANADFKKLVKILEDDLRVEID